MKPKRLLILGGSGNTGRPLAELLLQHAQVDLILAGRSLEKVQEVAHELNRLSRKERVTAVRLDAADRSDLRRAFKSVDMIVVASSTAQYTANVVDEALRAGIDYFDLQFSITKLQVLQSRARAIEKAGLRFITEGGFHPGLPALMVRHLAPGFDRMVCARVGSVIQQDWKSLDIGFDTAIEMIEEFRAIEMKSFRKGRWVQPGLKGPETLRMNFGKPFGRRSAVSMYLAEMGSLPGLLPELQDTGFYVGSFNWFVDYVVFMIIYPVLWLFPRRGVKSMAKFLLWGLKKFSRPPFGTRLRCEASGQKNGKPFQLALTLSHPDGYYFTAAPAVACLLQLLDGSMRKPGLYLQAIACEPQRFLKDLQSMGIEMELETHQ